MVSADQIKEHAKSAPPEQTDSPTGEIDYSAIVAALERIPADDYDLWVRVAIILYNTNPNLLPVWIWWSKRSNKFREGVCEEKWKSFGDYVGERLTIDSLFYLADQNNWRTPLSQLEAQNSEPRDSIIEGVIDKGDVVNIVAPPKLGKSYYLLQLVLNIAAGTLWLGKFATTQGRVLIVDNECHPDTIVSRMNRMITAMGLPQTVKNHIDVASLRGKLLTLDQLCERIARIPPNTYSLVVIDALYRVLPKGTDENANADVTRLYNSLDQAAAKQNCAIAVVHHTSKGVQTKKSVTDVGSGAGAQSRAADAHLILRPHAESGAVIFEGVVRAHLSIEPIVLVRDFPLWKIDDSLDPKQLRGDRPTMSLDEFIEWLPDGEHAKTDLQQQLRTDRNLTREFAKQLIASAIEAGKLIDLGQPSSRSKKMVRKAA